MPNLYLYGHYSKVDTFVGYKARPCLPPGEALEGWAGQGGLVPVILFNADQVGLIIPDCCKPHVGLRVGVGLSVVRPRVSIQISGYRTPESASGIGGKEFLINQGILADTIVLYSNWKAEK